MGGGESRSSAVSSDRLSHVVAPPEGMESPPEKVPSPAPASPPWNEFSLQLDENAGVFNLPRKTPQGEESGWFGTNNVTLSLAVQPKVLLSKYVGLFFKGGIWMRTADFDSEYSKSVMRPHIGPVAYVRPVETADHRLQIVDSPNYFYGTDLNGPASKSWTSHEFGNFASAAYTYKPAWNLTLDIHNWYVKGDAVTAGGTPASEDGVIIGSTVSCQPFATTGIPVIKGLEFYLRFREWGWKVVPEGKQADRKWWNEVTGGVKASWDFSVFE